MLFNNNDEEDRRLFQSQLAALMRSGHELAPAVNQIAAKCDPDLALKIQQARAKGAQGGGLIEGLVQEKLLVPELGAAARASSSRASEELLRAQLIHEAGAQSVHLLVRAHISRVFWLFVSMTSVTLLFYMVLGSYVMAPLLDIGENPSLPASLIAKTIFTVALTLMSLFLFLLGSIHFSLKQPPPDQWRRFRFLWKIPFTSRLFRKGASWSVMKNCQLLLKSGVPPVEAMNASLSAYGLQAISTGAVPLLPMSQLLDPATVRAANLASQLETLEPQLEELSELLRQELPFIAQNSARFIYYAGYLVLGALVGSVLIQVYEPIFRLSFFL